MAPSAQDELSRAVHKIATSGYQGPGEGSFEKNPLLEAFRKTGSKLWMDTGDKNAAQPLWKSEFTALTTNNTLANQVVQTGVMDQHIEKAVAELKGKYPDMSEEERVIEIGFIINCKIALQLVETFGVKVSVELHPKFAHDLGKTLSYGRRYFAVNPDFFIIKVPLTPEGYLAVRKLSGEKIPVNFTLGFSARQNYVAAILSNPAYVNVFLGRLNVVITDNKLGSGVDVGEYVTWATQRALNEAKINFPHVQTKLIAASIRNGEQVFKLAGIDCLTIPPAAVKQVQESGKSPEAVKKGEALVGQPGIQNPEQFKALWKVGGSLRELCEDFMRKNIDQFSGSDLVRTFEEAGIRDFFHQFSDEEKATIKADGKIPVVSKWEGKVALDDLMTQSALLSFVTDQEALDARIRGFL